MTLAQVFSCEFCEISKNTFFTEDHWTTASRLVINFSDLVPEAAIKRAVLKKFTIFAVRQLRWSLFLIKLQAFRSVTFLQRDSNTGVSCEYCEIFRQTYFEDNLPTAAYVVINKTFF